MLGEMRKKNLGGQEGPGRSRVLSSVLYSVRTRFPRMVPRLIRFTWSDLVIYCEVFFIGLMVYIHFIDA